MCLKLDILSRHSIHSQIVIDDFFDTKVFQWCRLLAVSLRPAMLRSPQYKACQSYCPRYD